MFREYVRPAILSLFILTIITGIIYPLFITGISQALFPAQANGSLLYRSGKIMGSSFIGQLFDDPKYLWGRISAATPQYNASSSSGSNMGPSNPALIDEIRGRIKALKDADPDNTSPVPADLVTSSASGLDPHISPAAAYYQTHRISKKRGMPESVVKEIIRKNTSGRFMNLLGEPVVNVLKVNLDLDSSKK